MRLATFLGLIITLLAMPVIAQQQSEPLTDRMTDRLKSEEFNVGFLLQSVGVFSFDDDNFNGGRKFDLGATRLDFRGVIDGNYTYRLQLDMRRSSPVLDAQVGYRFSDEFRIITGAYKPDLSADLDPSPANTDFINRARLVGAMMNSREIGIAVLGEFDGGLYYRLGMNNGTGLSRQNDNRFFYTARLGYVADLDPGSLELGLNAGINQTRLEQVGNTGLTSAGDRILLGVFTSFDLDRVFGTVELLQTQFDLASNPNIEETIIGFYATLGTRVSDRDELLGRWDHLALDVTGSSSDLFTFGWNHQATSLISFQLNLLAQFESDVDDQLGISGNFQFHF